MSSINIYNPTFLYIKQHSITGKLYFGRTCKTDPEKYLGSGLYWLKHIEKHGKEHVETLWYCLFLDENSLIECALLCSKIWNIVESEEWANLREENGLDGWPKGVPQTKESNNKRSKTQKGRIIPEWHKTIISNFHKGKVISEQTRNNMRIAQRKNYENIHHVPENFTFLGITHKKESKEKISNALKGLEKSEDHKNKIRNANIGIKHYNNGISCIAIKPNQSIPEGFFPGGLPRK